MTPSKLGVGDMTGWREVCFYLAVGAILLLGTYALATWLARG